MNLLLLETTEVDAEGHVRLVGRRADHLRRVLRVAPGRVLRAGLVDGPVGRAIVLAIESAAIALSFEPDATAPAQVANVDVLLAMPRPKALRRVLQTLAAFGVGEVTLVNAWRVEKSFFASPVLEPSALRSELLLGCEQGGRSGLPRVLVQPRLMAALDALPDGDVRLRVLCEPGRARGFEALRPLGDARLLLALGPEGGWIERELSSFEERGFRALSLGGAILRCEAAVTAALAQLDLLRRS